MARGERRWGRILGLATIAAGLLSVGWWTWRVRGDRRAMAGIQQDIREGRNATAARKLKAYLAAHPDSDQADYLLGACMLASGRPRDAEAAWVRVPPGSRYAARAILGRMQVRLAQGRPAEAERLVEEAPDDPRVEGSSPSILLGPILCQQGRLEEAQRIIEERWDRLDAGGAGASESAVQLVRLSIELRRQPVVVDAIRSVLDQAAALAPDDDRVWLGRANLAIRAGAYDEAARWIDRCLKERPGDVPVWRARLDWAVASGRVREAGESLKHLPAAEEPPTRIPRLSAWMAARRGDAEGERRALERLVAVDPEDFAAVDRLAGLSAGQGRSGRAEELRRQKAEIERLRARYETLFRRNQPRRDAGEMSRLAERLGRRFEARAFATIAAAADPDDEDARRRLSDFHRSGASAEGTGRTLAEALAAELDGAGVPSAAVPR